MLLIKINNRINVKGYIDNIIIKQIFTLKNITIIS